MDLSENDAFREVFFAKKDNKSLTKTYAVLSRHTKLFLFKIRKHFRDQLYSFNFL
jgi:hypothetical protein